MVESTKSDESKNEKDNPTNAFKCNHQLILTANAKIKVVFCFSILPLISSAMILLAGFNATAVAAIAETSFEKAQKP